MANDVVCVRYSAASSNKAPSACAIMQKGVLEKVSIEEVKYAMQLY